MSRWLRWRTAVDRVAAAILGSLLAPLMMILAAIVRRGSPGPGVLHLPRVGQHGRPFRLWKIRTMYAGDSSGRACGDPITSADDDRITAVGRRLRDSRLDEIPQLWNVVRGDMAILGPRPEAPEYVDCAIEAWTRVLRARPGIAGPTQLLVADLEAELVGADDGLRYRDDVLPIKLAIDDWYVARASPRIDALILASLVGRIALGRRPRRLFDEVCGAVPDARALSRLFGAVTLSQGATVQTPNEHSAAPCRVEQ